MTKPPVIISGVKVGRLKASWLLFKESWRFLQADKEMLWVPIIVGILQTAVFGILVVSLVMSGLFFGEEAIGSEDRVSWLGYIFLFLFYLLSALAIALSQAVITHIVYVRVHGGNATLRDGITAAADRFGAIFIWSLITSTVGMVLRAIAERSPLVGRIILALIGTAWNVLTYFVVPAIMIKKLPAPEAIKNSGQTFIATWGETLVSNITLGLVFLIAHVLALMAMIGLCIASMVSDVPSLAFVWIGLYVVWLVAAILINAALQSILQTLLYVYATEHTVDTLNFNADLLQNMLVKKTNPAAPMAAAPPPNQVSGTSSTPQTY